jgi:hypothetical protein
VASVLACDLLTVETAFLQRIYVLFFISLATRRIEYVACTANPDGAWIAQQARNLVMQLKASTYTFVAIRRTVRRRSVELGRCGHIRAPRHANTCALRRPTPRHDQLVDQECRANRAGGAGGPSIAG